MSKLNRWPIVNVFLPFPFKVSTQSRFTKHKQNLLEELSRLLGSFRANSSSLRQQNSLIHLMSPAVTKQQLRRVQLLNEKWKNLLKATVKRSVKNC